MSFLFTRIAWCLRSFVTVVVLTASRCRTGSGQKRFFRRLLPEQFYWQPARVELCATRTTVSPCIWTRLPEQHKSFPFAAWNPQHYPLSQLYLRNVFIALNTCISKGTAVKCAVSSLVLFRLFFSFFLSDANVLDSLVSASRQSYTFLFVKVYFVIINQLFCFMSCVIELRGFCMLSTSLQWNIWQTELDYNQTILIRFPAYNVIGLSLVFLDLHPVFWWFFFMAH